MIIDTHVHYDDEAFDEDREQVLSSLQSAGIGLVVNIGASIDTSKTTLDLTRKYSFIYGALGVHPDSVKDITDEDFLWLKKSVEEPRIVAIGEIGLDYHWNDNRDEQRLWFRTQMDLARQVHKPIVVHSRDAAADTLEDVKAANGQDIGGIIHCFSYGKDMAREYLNMGFYLGIGGVVTFKNAKKLKEVVEYAPIEQLVLETDCPYLSPEPNRGKRNSSLNLTYVIDKIADIKGITREDVIDITCRNAKNVYKLK